MTKIEELRIRDATLDLIATNLAIITLLVEKGIITRCELDKIKDQARTIIDQMVDNPQD